VTIPSASISPFPRMVWKWREERRRDFQGWGFS